MFYHSKELQFKARVSKPDPRFARLLLEQFGGGNGELKAAMQYFVQAFACHNPYPDKYDMLMDIATEELGHLEIVGATIQMLLAGVNGNLKDAAERNDVFGEGISKDDFIHSAFSVNPQFGVLTGGGPRLTDSNGKVTLSAPTADNNQLWELTGSGSYVLKSRGTGRMLALAQVEGMMAVVQDEMKQKETQA